MNFRISGLSPEPFRHLFGLSEEELAQKGVKRYVADKKPGFPDRIAMRDVDLGERVLLLNHVCQPADTPYRATHAIFIGEGSRGPLRPRRGNPRSLKGPLAVAAGLQFPAYDDRRRCRRRQGGRARHPPPARQSLGCVHPCAQCKARLLFLSHRARLERAAFRCKQQSPSPRARGEGTPRVDLIAARSSGLAWRRS